MILIGLPVPLEDGCKETSVRKTTVQDGRSDCSQLKLLQRFSLLGLLENGYWSGSSRKRVDDSSTQVGGGGGGGGASCSRIGVSWKPGERLG